MDIKRLISFYLQKVYNTNSPENQIRMRIRWFNNVVQFNVGYTISPTKWDSRNGRCQKGTTNKNGDTAFQINKEISRLESLADDLFKNFEVAGVIPARKEYRDAFNVANGKIVRPILTDSITVQRAFSEYVSEASHRKSWEWATVAKHNSIRNILGSYNKDWPLSGVNEVSLMGYYDFLINRGMKNSSIKKHLSFIFAFLRWCNEKEYLENADWKKFKPEIKLIHRKQVIFLTWDELMRVYNLKFPKDKAYLERARDVFCFQCFTSLRFSDVYKLKRGDVYPDYIRVCTEKTDTELRIDLNKYSRAILKKYEDDFFTGGKALPVSSNQKSNEYIKEVCFIAGITEPVTNVYYRGSRRFEETEPKYRLIGTHTGRRTFICNALMLGISPEIVMKWTGHSNYKAMQPYIDIADKAKEEAMKLFDR